MRSYLLLTASFIFFMTGRVCSMQDSIPFRDRQKTIGLAVFEKQVDDCFGMLIKDKLKDIPDSMHIQIMYCLNTIFMSHNTDGLPRFRSGRYQRLTSITEKINYTKHIIEVYKEWVPNRGMGFYFPKLKMELYGTPSLYAWYDVR